MVLEVNNLVFWNSIHLEVASDSFCFLINSSWLLVFILQVFFMIFSGFNLYCRKGIHFSQNHFPFFGFFMSLWFSFHFWSRDLLRELDKKYEVLLIIFFLVFLLFLVSEGLLFVSFFWTSFHSLSSATLGTWPGEGFYLPDPCELTFANTLLLSNAAISLGNAFISLEISSQFHIFFSLTLRQEKRGRTIGQKLPQDAINPAHGSLLRVNSPSAAVKLSFSYRTPLTSVNLPLLTFQLVSQLLLESSLLQAVSSPRDTYI